VAKTYSTPLGTQKLRWLKSRWYPRQIPKLPISQCKARVYRVEGGHRQVAGCFKSPEQARLLEHCQKESVLVAELAKKRDFVEFCPLGNLPGGGLPNALGGKQLCSSPDQTFPARSARHQERRPGRRRKIDPTFLLRSVER
jgi:hypothetical protein